MIDDEKLSAHLAMFGGAPLPGALPLGTAGLQRRIMGHRPPRLITALVAALSVGLAVAVGLGSVTIAPASAQAVAPALQSGMALAPSSLLDPH